MDHRTSGLEQLARDFFKETLPNEKAVYNERFSWLLIFNPNFKKRTERELDIYFPDLRVGIEINGGTHQHPLVRAVDKKKHALCKRNNVVLYDVWNIEDFWKLRTRLYKLGYQVAPEISQGLIERLERYGAKKMNKYEEGYLLRDVTRKARDEQSKYFYSKNKKPMRHKQHQKARHEALQRLKKKALQRELAYIEAE